MQRRAHPSAITVLSVALVGVAFIGGCALIYNFDYTSEGASSGAGGSASSSGPTTSSSVSAGGGGASASASASSSTSGGGGDGGTPSLPVVLWQQRFGSAGADQAGHPGLDIAPNGDVFITGIFHNSIDLGDGAISCSGLCSFLAKLDPATGKTVWSRLLAGSTGFVSSLAATPDGGVVVAGTFVGTFTPKGLQGVGGQDMFLAKFDAGGTCVWGNVYGDQTEQRVNAVAVDDAGKIYLAGLFSGSVNLGGCNVNASTPPNAFIAQFDDMGVCKWAVPFPIPSQGLSLAPIGGATGVAFGGTFMGILSLPGGITLNSTNSGNLFLTAFDSAAGMPLFGNAFPGADINLASDAFTAGAVFGITPPVVANKPIGMGALGNDGKTLSPPMPIPGTEQGVLESIACTPTGDRVITGYSLNDLTLKTLIKNQGAKDIFVGHLTSAGAVKSGVGYGNAQAQSGRNIRSDSGGDIYLFGEFDGDLNFGMGPLTPIGSPDLFLVKFSDKSFPLK